ncbi:MAG TPA: class I SAM-dependent methyltransferase [Oxalicibacterium sp.]
MKISQASERMNVPGSVETSVEMSLRQPDRAQALHLLGERLLAEGYHFTTVTPVTHGRINARSGNEWARTTADVFGWSRPFRMSDQASSPVSPALHALMHAAQILQPVDGGWRSTLRASTLNGRLYFHSAYPTDQDDSVFFGPDTYRFVRALKTEFSLFPAVHRAVDIGCGAGPGALTIAAQFPQSEIFAVDINDAALMLTTVNAQLAKLENVAVCKSDLLTGLAGEFDLIVSNPPYLVDPGARTYRHGGGTLGADLSLAIVDAALQRLTPQGVLLMYTGAAIFEGRDAFLMELEQRLDGGNHAWSYEEIDPDVFGEELDEPAYAHCDRIAAVWLRIWNRTMAD